ncbi:hypothetical protein BJ508DRAFT_382207 [Ascobolus immersus RN42]|uniref:Uncharacterized protein n=1 Tax=Ascobolus immersus RN42 TaxID=1160509 RepID=A0A3N4H820_ASCIM|nr:hypothetical protein BJ508DRAFT_382207 [Ascobolus immersus RN42]
MSSLTPISRALAASTPSRLRNVCLSCRLGLGLLRLTNSPKTAPLRTFSTLPIRRSDHLDPTSPAFDPLPPGLLKDPIILATSLRPKRWQLKQQINDAKSLPVTPFPGSTAPKLTFELLFGPTSAINTPEELKSEIEKVRPHSKLVTIERREQLVELLNQKFNKAQLWEYWSARYLEKHELGKREVSARKSAVKARIIDSILDEIWEVTAVASQEGAEDVLVKKTIKVDRRDLFFLIRQDGKILRFWSLSTSAKFAVSLGDLTIAIVATEKQISHIESWLAKVRAQINSRTIDMKWHSQLGQMPGGGILAELSRLTNTFIEAVDETHIRVSNLGKKEGPFEDVRRLLYLYYDHAFNTSYTPLTPFPDTPLTQTPLAEPEALPWRNRNTEWLRYSLPSPDATPPLPSPEFTHAQPSPSSSTPPPPPPQTPDPPLPPPPPPPTLSAIPGINSLLKHLTLITPPPIYSQESIDEPLTHPPTHPDNTSVILRFTACPWTHKDFKLFPRVEIMLDVSEDGKVHSPQTRFVVARKVVDIYRPDRPVDVRFEKILAQPGSVSPELEKEVERYLEQSNIDFGDGGRIKPESELRVWVPEELVRKGGEVVTPAVENAEGVEMRDVRYLFSEMEVWQGVEFEFEVGPRAGIEAPEGEEGQTVEEAEAVKERKKVKVIRRDVEGGISGGRRVELVVEPMAEEGEEVDVEAFVEGVWQLGGRLE